MDAQPNDLSEEGQELIRRSKEGLVRTWIYEDTAGSQEAGTAPAGDVGSFPDTAKKLEEENAEILHRALSALFPRIKSS